ncbi:MAG: hypothetical protein JWN39_2073 [Ilumatobacteraceae bacterium]|nr:hypothetical protein [Ilumatobacteraceae bacterium]
MPPYAHLAENAKDLSGTAERSAGGDQWWQPQAEPQPPPDIGAAAAALAGLALPPPTLAKTDSRRTVSACPAGHVAG